MATGWAEWELDLKLDCYLTCDGIHGVMLCKRNLKKTKMTIENHHVYRRCIFIHGCFFHCHVSFRGCRFRWFRCFSYCRWPLQDDLQSMWRAIGSPENLLTLGRKERYSGLVMLSFPPKQSVFWHFKLMVFLSSMVNHHLKRISLDFFSNFKGLLSNKSQFSKGCLGYLEHCQAQLI